MTKPNPVLESLVRTACLTAKTRAMREECRIDVWVSMSASAPAVGDPGKPTTWVRSHDEGAPYADHYEIHEIRDESAFVLCWFDQDGEIHVEPVGFNWYRDATMQGIPPMYMCSNCGHRCVEGQLVELMQGIGYAPREECESCHRPLRMPGL